MRTAFEKSNLTQDDLISRDILKNAFDLCVRKTRNNIKQLVDEPKSGAWAVDGNFFRFEEGFNDIGNWTSSFFTGMALMAWRETEDEYFMRHVNYLAPHYITKIFTHHRDTMHDLGFLYSLYSVALHKLTGDRVHCDIGLRAADILARRFHSRGNFIRAWGRMGTPEFDNMAIIDCMMNLPLLYWASEQTSDKFFKTIATSHADTVLKTFIRADDSIYHAYRFDLNSGQPIGGDNYGGCAIESQWARGTAWGIYGFALSYKYTRDEKYLDASLRLARKFIASLDDEIIPMWEFKLAANTPRIRDASAGSVAMCGFQELLRHKPHEKDIEAASRRLLGRLCSDDYLNRDAACAGVQRNGQVGTGTPGGAQNAYTSWGDYFLMEALARELTQFEPWW